MKKEIHPNLFEVTARCACGNIVETVSTKQRIDLDICSACHPFFTGKQKFVDTAGRIDRFQQRYDKAAKQKEAAKKVVVASAPSEEAAPISEVVEKPKKAEKTKAKAKK